MIMVMKIPPGPKLDQTSVLLRAESLQSRLVVVSMGLLRLNVALRIWYYLLFVMVMKKVPKDRTVGRKENGKLERDLRTAQLWSSLVLS